MRLGLFGGSFDPVHNGHLALAGCCAEQARLEEVWLIPSAVQPFKQQGPVATDADRCAMLRLAIGGRPGLVLCTVEVERGGVSYTVETLRQLRQEKPDAEFFFPMGADTLRELPGWREPDEVLRLATPLVVGRPGEPEPETTIRHVRITMPATDISSSDLRRRLAAGESITGLVPPAVEAYIAERGLYR